MTRKLRILQLGSSSGLYGAEFWILALIKHLDNAHFTSQVAAICDDLSSQAMLCQRANENGHKSITLRAKHRFSFSVISQLRQFILREKIDIVHTHGYKTDFMGRLATLRTDCKIISTPHGWTEKPDFKLGVYELLNRCLFPFLHAVAPLSQDLYDPLTAIPFLKRKLYLIKNGVDLSEFDEPDNLSKDIISLKNQGKFILGYIGRLTPGKGLDTLLKALALTQDNNIHLAIVGDGEQADELHQLADKLGISSSVTFFGFKSNRITYLNGFNAFVLPSLSEGIPRCLMEAMAAKIPIIASDIPGCRYLIDGKTTGLLFEVNNIRELSDKVRLLKANDTLASSLAENAKSYVVENYSAKKMAQEYANLYQRIDQGL